VPLVPLVPLVPFVPAPRAGPLLDALAPSAGVSPALRSSAPAEQDARASAVATERAVVRRVLEGLTVPPAFEVCSSGVPS
jgi:hypothetical protein